MAMREHIAALSTNILTLILLEHKSPIDEVQKSC